MLDIPSQDIFSFVVEKFAFPREIRFPEIFVWHKAALFLLSVTGELIYIRYNGY